MISNESGQTDAGAIIGAVQQMGEVDSPDIQRGTSDKAEVLIVPKGKEVVSVKKYLDEYLEYPERRKGTAELHQLESFIHHVNRFKDSTSAIFARTETPGSASLTAVFDYHPGEQQAEKPLDIQTSGVDGPKAGWLQHRAIYRFPISEQWKAWTSEKEPMPMQDFAEFLEERVLDVLDPADGGKTGEEFATSLGIKLATPQRLLELSREFSVHVGSKVTTANKLSSGETQLLFSEEHKDASGAPMSVPGGFLLQIPPFRGDDPYVMPVRLRYRVVGAGVVFIIALHRVDKIWEDAVTRACGKVVAETDLPFFYGSPEAGT